jgi:hypothetical protein
LAIGDILIVVKGKQCMDLLEGGRFLLKLLTSFVEDYGWSSNPWIRIRIENNAVTHHCFKRTAYKNFLMKVLKLQT